VTGIIGVAAPVITWRASVDSQRAGSHAERERADLAELRAILDRSLVDLDKLRRKEETSYTSWHKELIRRPPRAARLARFEALRVAIRRVQVDTDRVTLRLGIGRISHLMEASMADAINIDLFLYRHSPKEPKAVLGAISLLGTAAGRIIAFTVAAHRVVGSHVP
jgi:hypothetical protein